MPVYVRYDLTYEVRPNYAQVMLDRIKGFRFDMLRDHGMTNYMMAFRP
jgi:hypothetical protein